MAAPFEDAVRCALSTRGGGAAAGPAESWRILALIAARKDGDPAARPWFSSGYLPRPAPTRDLFPDSGPAMRPDPETRPASRNGTVDDEDDLEHLEGVVTDCTEAHSPAPDAARGGIVAGPADAIASTKLERLAAEELDAAG